MKKVSYVLIAMLVASPALAGFDADLFVSEITRGVDVVSAPHVAPNIIDDAPGALGAEVYETAGVIENIDTRMFIPTSMYLRMGGGLNLGFATSDAYFNGDKYESSGSYTTQIGLGWNLSSYVRTELDFQTTTLKFSDLDDLAANYQTFGGMLYFDLARRFVQLGDITHRRTFVPFIGVGAALGAYRFNGENGADGAVIAVPRAVLGFNVMFNDLIGLDVYYQYQMMISNGFGWNAPHSGVDGISNIMASFRVNF
ncbi:MAG: hypothetical protein IKV10_03195 [Alphaproteobacteria bacterium]|nr:hypothetical protein [Alphaproteobacteria bacterium]